MVMIPPMKQTSPMRPNSRHFLLMSAVPTADLHWQCYSYYKSHVIEDKERMSIMKYYEMQQLECVVRDDWMNGWKDRWRLSLWSQTRVIEKRLVVSNFSSTYLSNRKLKWTRVLENMSWCKQNQPTTEQYRSENIEKDTCHTWTSRHNLVV